MNIHVYDDKQQAGKEAAALGAKIIRAAIAENGRANVIVATGASQFEMLSHLVREPDIAWDKVTGFHLDEYVGMKITHPASFRLYLWNRFVRELSLPMSAFHYVNGEQDAQAECQRLDKLIKAHPIDL